MDSNVTTTDISFDPALHAYNHSDTRQVLDLVLYRQIGTFSALEIANVAELLPSWISSNIGAITDARADDTRDWYFPVFTGTVPSTRPGTSSSWSGIHHLAENQASAAVQPLPTLPALPFTWEISTIVASGGGLLLLMPPVYPIPSAEGVGNQHGLPRLTNSISWRRTRSRLSYEQSKVPQDWKPLLVWNPLTGTWRELPVPPNCGSLKWRYDEVLIDMIVDEQANSYTIVMTFRISFCVCVYESTSNKWGHWQYITSARREMAWRSDVCANAVVGGRLRYAFIEFRLGPPTRAILGVYEIKFETGEWKLRVRVLGFLVLRFVNRVQARIGRGASEILRHLGLLECMGVMYVVIPTRNEDTINSINNNNFAMAVRRAMASAHRSLEDGFQEMPVQFHILGLNCQNAREVYGVLRIHVPGDRNDLSLRRTSLLEKTSSSDFLNRNWFSCTAKGRVIWVACEDYLLQYDVTSGQSKTQIIMKPELLDAKVSYRPGFHMKP